MAKSLVIVESPAKAKTIKKFLGKNYVIKASVGHVIDLPKSKLGIDIENNFQPKYITIRGKGPILKEIRDEAKKADKIYLATDPDREGEAISWHLSNALKIKEDTPCRIEFNEITKTAVKNAIKNPRPIDKNLVDAQQARRVLDRLVGYKISPLLWRKIRKGLSAGRVQSVATKMIKDREMEIRNFVPKEYWELTLDVENSAKEKFQVKFHSDDSGKKEILSEEEVNIIIEKIKDKDLIVTDIKKGKRKRNPSPSFTTSSLQQEASNRLGFSTKKTMSIAQQLYEGIELKTEGIAGLITYIRTDSTRISDESKKSVQDYIINNLGEKYTTTSKSKVKKKNNTQDAHEAIRPTDVLRKPELIKDSLTRDQYKLYKLIWERFVASQMSPAIYDTLAVELTVNGIVLKINGSRLNFDGFLRVYSFASMSEEVNIPQLELGEKINIKDIIPSQHFTQPPARYTEASLVKAMEELGIGRPSTYSPTISTILSRGYVERDGRNLKPTELGEMVTEILEEYFTDIIDVNFTADFEKRLDNVEEGVENWQEIIKKFYDIFEEMLKKAEEDIEEIDMVEESDVLCEKCNVNMLIKYGRYGKFLACANYPECTVTKPIVNKIGVKCPQCEKGDIIERKSKRGRIFYGCSEFPKCKFASWSKPINERCPECNSLLTHKINKKSEKLQCINKDCKYTKDITKKE